MKRTRKISLSFLLRLLLLPSIAGMLLLSSCSNPTDVVPPGTVIDPPKPYEVKLKADDMNGFITEQAGSGQAVTRPALLVEYADFYPATADTNQVIIDTSGAVPVLKLHLKIVSKAHSLNEVQELFLQRFVVDIDSIPVGGDEVVKILKGEAQAQVVWRDLPAQYAGREMIAIRPNNPSLGDGFNVEVFAWKVTNRKEVRVRINGMLPARREYLVNNVKKAAERKVTMGAEFRIKY